MPAVPKLLFCTDVGEPTVSSTLFRRPTRWLLKPMSPRRYQPPKSSTTGGGAYIGGGGAIAMSAANAAVDNRVAAPAAMSDFTLRIVFVLLSGEADRTPHIKNSQADDGTKFLSGA